jgi:hypothetical protein
LGILGTFYPFKTLSFYDKSNPERTTSVALTSTPNFNQTKAGVDGLLPYFTPYWTLNGSTYWSHLSIDDNNNVLTDDWTWTNATDIVDQNGNEIQSLNPLQVNSAAQYGYNKRFPVAVAENALHSSIVFESFEEYSTDFLYNCLDGFSPTYGASSRFNIYNQTNWHWMMWPNFTPGRASITTIDAHTGKNCLKLGHDAIEIPFSLPEEPTYPSVPALQSQYFLDKNNTIQGFYPNNLLSTGNFPYLLTYWGKYDPNIVNPYFQLQYYSGSAWVNINCNEAAEPQVPIDGWIRKTIEIIVPQAAKNQKMRLVVFKGLIDNSSGIGYVTNPDIDDLKAANANIYLDDIRIMPKVSNMKCFVYDNIFYRLMAELDENHYATFYEYDDEGNMVRTKKETVRGIKTVQESKQNLRKRQ